MKRIHAYEYGAESANLDRNGDCRRVRLVTDATRKHETACSVLRPFDADGAGESYRQLVRARIWGAHHGSNAGTRQGARSIYAVY